jgi:3-isopropylmalate/(R)-2-methylmalate dehydratase small subunit
VASLTLFEKIWRAHEVVPERPDTPAVLFIDLHLVHEVTSPQAFSMLRSLGLPVRRPARTLATMDHSTPTLSEQVFGNIPIKIEADGRPNPEFVLNRPESAHCEILVAGRNFGCGSSREHAPWALLDYGIRAIVSAEIADIFRNNSLKSGILPVTVDDATAAWLLGHPGVEIDIDLSSQRLTLPSGVTVSFPIEPFARHCLLSGIDELGFLRGKLDEIERYEAAREH